MNEDKDRQLAKLHSRIEQLERGQRVERLERGQGFLVATMSSTLSTALGGGLLYAATWLWRNPDVLVSEAAGRVLAVMAGVGACVSGALFVGSLIVMRRSAEWRLLDRRARIGIVAVAVLEMLSWILGVLLVILLR
jgi:hypothetical protein